MDILCYDSTEEAMGGTAPLLPIDDGRLLNQLPVWAPEPAIRHKILVDNPARL